MTVVKVMGRYLRADTRYSIVCGCLFLFLCGANLINYLDLRNVICTFACKYYVSMRRFHSLFDFIGRYKYAVVSAIIVMIVGFVDDNSCYNRYLRLQEIATLEEEIDMYRSLYEEDTRRLNALEVYDNVERLAREKYLMKRDNEDVFIIRRDSLME